MIKILHKVMNDFIVLYSLNKNWVKTSPDKILSDDQVGNHLFVALIKATTVP